MTQRFGIDGYLERAVWRGRRLEILTGFAHTYAGRRGYTGWAWMEKLFMLAAGAKWHEIQRIAQRMTLFPGCNVGLELEETMYGNLAR